MKNLRTGDLGFLFEGELFFTGRMKDLIKIRGNSFYPDDIEQVVQVCHPAFRPGCCAAFTIDIDGEEKLVIIQEIRREFPDVNQKEAIDLIRKAVFQKFRLHTQDAVLVKSGSINKTSNGKIQRHACRKNYLAETIERI